AVLPQSERTAPLAPWNIAYFAASRDSGGMCFANVRALVCVGAHVAVRLLQNGLAVRVARCSRALHRAADLDRDADHGVAHLRHRAHAALRAARDPIRAA